MYRKHNIETEKAQRQALKQFLYRLFPKKDWIEIRPLPESQDKRNYRLTDFYRGHEELINNLHKIIPACKNAGHALYFGVLPRKQRGKGTKENTCNGMVIWSDIDDKDTGGREQTWKLVDRLPLEPSAIVESGGGVHIYYYLNISTQKEKIEELNRKLLRICGGDKKAWNCDRILRMPLSWHLKGEPKKVIFAAHSARIYKLKTIEQMLQDIQLKPQKQLSISSTLNEYKSKPIISGKIAKLMELHTQLNDYYHNRGKTSTDQSGSAYDWIFAKELAYLGANQEDACNALTAKIVNDGRNKNYKNDDGTTKKGKTQEYIKKTVARAFAHNAPATATATAPARFGERDTYPEIRLERYPDDYGERYKRGKPLANLANAHKILDELNRAIKGLIRYNQFTSQLEFQGERIADHHITQLRLEISWCYGVQFKKDDIGQMIEFIAHQKDNSYHPVKEYLESLNYDSSTDEPLADLWLERFCTVKKAENDEHTKLIREMGRAWLISAVARIYEPGCKVDCSLIFLGKQGIGKSTVFRYLAKKDEWFSDSAIDIRGGRDSYSKLRGKWIYEFAELSSTKNRDSTVTKSFLSSQSDSYRPAYARYEIDQKRQVVFCGSSNELEIFRDVTGDRRFYPIALENVDFEALKESVDKIWAHAVYLYKKGDPWRLVERDGIDYEKLLSEYQEPYKATDSWMEAINNSPLIGTQSGWSLKELLEQILDIQPPQQNRAVLMRLSGLLSGAGWIKYRSYDKNTKKNRYLWKRS